jgi:hypothetical protein
MMSENNKYDKLEQKVDRILDDTNQTKVDMAEVKTNLSEHMRRTLANEESNRLLKEYIETFQKDVDNRIEPLDQFRDRIKFLGVVIAAAGSVFMFMHELGLFKLFLHVN